MKRTFGFLALISLFAAAASAQTFDWTAPDSVPNGKGYYVEVACWPYYPDDPGLKATLYKNGSFFATNTSDGGPNVIVGGYTTDTGPQTVHYEVDFWNNWELYWEGSDSRDVAISANQAPQVAFDWATSALANGGTLSGGGWAADPESGAPVNRVELFVDGVNRGNATLGGDRPDVSNAFGRSDYRYSGFNFSFGISGLAVGTHYVAVRAFDSLGAYTSQSRPFTINNTAPTVNVSGNRTSANVGDTVTLTLSGADVDSNLRAVNLWVKTPNTDWRNIRGDSTINGGYVENTTIDNAISSGGANVGSLGAVNRTFAFTLNEGFGTYQFHARSIDAKNATSATGVVNVTVANRAPTVSLSDPPYTIKQGETINLSSNAADADSNLATHHFWRRGPRTGNNFDDWNDWASDVGAPTGWSITNPGVPTGAGSSSKPAAFTPSSPGYYQFHVNAHDSAGENAGGATTHSVFVAPLPSSNISATVTNGTSASGSGTLFLHLGNTINVSSTATAAGWISEHAILRYTGTTSPSGVTGMAGGAPWRHQRSAIKLDLGFVGADGRRVLHNL